MGCTRWIAFIIILPISVAVILQWIYSVDIESEHTDDSSLETLMHVQWFESATGLVVQALLCHIFVYCACTTPVQCSIGSRAMIFNRLL